MENVPEWIKQAPELVPGILIGGIIGIVAGLVSDYREDNLPVSWWQLGGIGAGIGGFANFLLLA